MLVELSPDILQKQLVKMLERNVVVSAVESLRVGLELGKNMEVLARCLGHLWPEPWRLENLLLRWTRRRVLRFINILQLILTARVTWWTYFDLFLRFTRWNLIFARLFGEWRTAIVGARIRVTKSLVARLSTPINAFFDVNLVVVLLHLFMQVSLLVVNYLF